MDVPPRKRGAMPAYESLTARERTLLEAEIAGATPREAGLIAGYSADTTTQYWKRAKAKPAYKEAMRECLNAVGLDAPGLAARVKHGADHAAQYLTTKDGQIHERPDYHARAKYVDMALKVQGAYPDPRDQGSANVQVVVIGPENSLAYASPFSAPIVEAEGIRVLPNPETRPESNYARSDPAGNGETPPD